MVKFCAGINFAKNRQKIIYIKIEENIRKNTLLCTSLQLISRKSSMKQGES